MTRTVLAPAKINLHLEVCGRRPDGYHELGMVMQRVSLYDRLHITVGEAPGVQVVCPGLELAEGEENIAARAARCMLARLDRPVGVEIVIEKQIPAAAGLGGGSSDAASVLLALNEMLGLYLEDSVLSLEGVRLGADVPFFLFGETAWATGIGERLEKFSVAVRPWYVLVNPGIPVSTAWVYRNLGLTGVGSAAKLPGFPRTAKGFLRLLYNDLERVTAAHFPQVREVKRRLLSLGADGALMSGSGPTVFGVYFEQERAEEAVEALVEEHEWQVFLVRPI